MFGWIRSLRRRGLKRRELPAEWLGYLQQHVPFFAELEGAERERFLDFVKVLVWEKHYEGQAGLEVSDEHRVVIAAAAARIVLHLGLRYYDRMNEILVYPYVYSHADKDGAIFGQVSSWGTVVLSWPAVLAGLRNPGDGHDTALHEFAHVLDLADGAFDGTPVLDGLAAYQPWARVMSRHYDRLRKRRGSRSVLRDYGATNEAEFFAVASEAFFERPQQLAARKPELYDELKRFYRCDPARGAQKML